MILVRAFVQAGKTPAEAAPLRCLPALVSLALEKESGRLRMSILHQNQYVAGGPGEPEKPGKAVTYGYPT